MNIFNLICKTPLYPHWLDVRNTQKKNVELLKSLYGKVIETGAGNSDKKEYALKINKKIKEYVATDYDSWDTLFENQTKSITKFGKLTEALYGKPKEKENLDAICSALDLRYKKNMFDCYCSFEVLEHIENPYLFFQEACRVLKRGGICITVMPFLFREHGGIENDFQRFTKGGFHQLAKNAGFKVVNISTYCCFGTTMASLVNQYVVRKIVEGKLIPKILLFMLSPFIFLTTNGVGWIIDSLDNDERFAERYHVVMKKL